MPAKKKNMLYGELTKYKNKYTRYKNKLINIMRVCQKEYYNKRLANSKNNIMSIWNKLNNIIRNGSTNIS